MAIAKYRSCSVVVTVPRLRCTCLLRENKSRLGISFIGPKAFFCSINLAIEETDPSIFLELTNRVLQIIGLVNVG